MNGEQARGALLEAFAERAPRRVAQLLEQGDVGDAADVVARLSPTLAAPVVAAMSPRTAARMMTALDPASAGILCTQLDPPALADLLRRLDREAAAALLERLPSHVRRDVTRLLTYQRDRVGAHANPNVVAVAQDATVAEVIACAAEADDDATDLILIVDERRAPVGRLSCASVLRATPAASVRTLDAAPARALAADALLADATAEPAWSTASALPVVDASGRLLGVVRHHALLRALHDSELGAGADPTRAAAELATLYAVGLSALWQLAGAALPWKSEPR